MLFTALLVLLACLVQNSLCSTRKFKNLAKNFSEKQLLEYLQNNTIRTSHARQLIKIISAGNFPFRTLQALLQKLENSKNNFSPSSDSSENKSSDSGWQEMHVDYYYRPGRKSQNSYSSEDDSQLSSSSDSNLPKDDFPGSDFKGDYLQKSNFAPRHLQDNYFQENGFSENGLLDVELLKFGLLDTDSSDSNSSGTNSSKIDSSDSNSSGINSSKSDSSDTNSSGINSSKSDSSDSNFLDGNSPGINSSGSNSSDSDSSDSNSSDSDSSDSNSSDSDSSDSDSSISDSSDNNPLDTNTLNSNSSNTNRLNSNPSQIDLPEHENTLQNYLQTPHGLFALNMASKYGSISLLAGFAESGSDFLCSQTHNPINLSATRNQRKVISFFSEMDGDFNLCDLDMSSEASCVDWIGTAAGCKNYDFALDLIHQGTEIYKETHMNSIIYTVENTILWELKTVDFMFCLLDKIENVQFLFSIFHWMFLNRITHSFEKLLEFPDVLNLFLQARTAGPQVPGKCNQQFSHDFQTHLSQFTKLSQKKLLLEISKPQKIFLPLLERAIAKAAESGTLHVTAKDT